MESFQKFVLIFFVILLCFILISVGMSLKYSHVNNWPPVTPSCPDYWTTDSSGNCVNYWSMDSSGVWINTRDLGTTTPSVDDKPQTMNFNVSPYVGITGLCAKFNWANNNGVYWDGVNYGITNPCALTGPP
jgi:hypothetical protein